MELMLHMPLQKYKKTKDKSKMLINTKIRFTLNYNYHSTNEILRIIAISKFIYKEFS